MVPLWALSFLLQEGSGSRAKSTVGEKGGVFVGVVLSFAVLS